LTSNIRECRFVAGVEIESLGFNPLVGGSRLLLQSGQHDLDTVLDGWSATLPEPGDSAIWFDFDAIIDRRPNPLLAAKVSLGGSN
jgi:hypothetical protein